jgi:rhodanese-related sulfurtransferase
MDGEVSPETVRDLLDGGADGDAVCVVDIRSPAAYERGHIPGSECVPLPELPSRADRVADADRIVTVCPHGEASVRAARLLAAYEAVDESTRVESMAGGLTAWEYDLESSGGDAGESPDAPF